MRISKPIRLQLRKPSVELSSSSNRTTRIRSSKPHGIFAASPRPLSAVAASSPKLSVLSCPCSESTRPIRMSPLFSPCLTLPSKTRTIPRCHILFTSKVMMVALLLDEATAVKDKLDFSLLVSYSSLELICHRNKIDIVEAGALEPIITFLKSQNISLQEYATASLLTLSASATNKPIICASGAIPLLVEILRDGTPQAKADAVMALSNLSTHPTNLTTILETNPIPLIVNLLKTCKKSSKTAEKCCALIESLVGFDEGRTALISEEGSILAVVEVLETGTLQSREHAVGALLTMCESNRCKYREPILREGVIPGLLELTVQGTPKSQLKARSLLKLLRESPHPRSEMQPDTIENIVCNIISRIDGDDDQSGKAKKMLAEMVQVSMEQSLRHLQQRALVCTPTSDLPITNCASEVSSK
ncbi:U-box domain-containing protein 4 [Senna tora]|uniref:U-box domain-containing protein 4 n=1 Tax=Senna tora TaxID=362788 RepID=A0A834WS71_9FABA|nr:U-box domain-containing protein 4 [Senna tora]